MEVYTTEHLLHVLVISEFDLSDTYKAKLAEMMSEDK